MNMTSIMQNASTTGPEEVLSGALNALREVIKDLIDGLNEKRLLGIRDKQKRLKARAEEVAAICVAHHKTLAQIPQDIRRVRDEIQTSSNWDAWTLGLSKMRRTNLGNKAIFKLQAKQRAARYSLDSNQATICETFQEIACLNELYIESQSQKHASISGWITQFLVAISDTLLAIACFMTNEFRSAMEHAVHAVKGYQGVGRFPPAFAAA